MPRAFTVAWSCRTRCRASPHCPRPKILIAGIGDHDNERKADNGDPVRFRGKQLYRGASQAAPKGAAGQWKVAARVANNNSQPGLHLGAASIGSVSCVEP